MCFKVNCMYHLFMMGWIMLYIIDQSVDSVTAVTFTVVCELATYT